MAIVILPGTLDLLILRTLRADSLHAYGIARRIEGLSGDAFEVSGGSLFPALRRLAKAGALESEWGETESGRRARFYSLTALGHERLETDTGNWELASRAVQAILEAT